MSGLAQATATPGHPGRLISVTRFHGLVIRLSVPRRSYPLNALARTTITIRNTSKTPVETYEVQSEVLQAGGRVLYPPAFAGQPVSDGGPVLWRPCSRSEWNCLKPGQTRSLDSIVILRSSRVAPLITLITQNNAHPSVLGRAVHVRLTATHPLRVRITPHGSALVAHVLPVPVHAGKLYSAEEFNCYEKDSSSQTGQFPGVWVTTTGSSLRVSLKGCSKGYLWHFVAGWLGHSVVEART